MPEVSLVTNEFDRSAWEALGLSPETIDITEKEGFIHPTPIQEKSIPIALEGKDLLASARTGSGKTVAFSFPMIEKIRGRSGTLGLILCPTREIALQTHENIEKFASSQGLRSVAVIGGVSMKQDEAALREYPQIIVGTPGRICDHQERGNIWLEFIEMVVLDEADRMLDMGFAKQLNQIMDEVPSSAQTLFFSATIAGETEKIARKYLHEPERISMGSALSVAETVAQELLWVNRGSKMREILRILGEEEGTVIIFTRTKLETQKLWRSIFSKGYHESAYISSDKMQKHREQALTDFRSGKIRVLVATDVAGRGIHVEDVAHVINYDFPLETEDYIHRVGRTGRKGKSGRATTFVTPQDSKLLIQLERTLKITIPEKRAEDYVFEPPGSGGGRKKSHRPRGGGRSSKRGGKKRSSKPKTST